MSGQYRSINTTPASVSSFPANTKHLHNICTMLNQRLRRWSNIVQMLCRCFVFTGLLWMERMGTARFINFIYFGRVHSPCRESMPFYCLTLGRFPPGLRETAAQCRLHVRQMFHTLAGIHPPVGECPLCFVSDSGLLIQDGLSNSNSGDLHRGERRTLQPWKCHRT